MAKIKQEVKEELLASDVSLLQWTEPVGEIKLMEEQKLGCRNFKVEVKDCASEVNSVEQEDIDNGDKLLPKSRPAKRKTGTKNEKITKSVDFQASDIAWEKNVGTNRNSIINTNQSAHSVSWRKTLECAPLSDSVKSLCKYQCPKCKEVYSGSTNILKHFSKSRHVIWKRGELNNYLIKIVAHQCHMCHKKLLCDYTTLYSHFVSSHKITFTEYIAKTDVEHTTPIIRRKKEFKNGREACRGKGLWGGGM